MDEIERLRGQARKARQFAVTVDEKTRTALEDYARECDQKAGELAESRSGDPDVSAQGARLS